MEIFTGTVIATIALSVIAWKGYKKYNNPALWLVFLPMYSIVHTFIGWHILGLAFRYDTNPEQYPLYASVLAPSFSGVSLIGMPLEFIGLSDEIAYSIAFGLNAIVVGILIVLCVQWLAKRKKVKNA